MSITGSKTLQNRERRSGEKLSAKFTWSIEIIEELNLFTASQRPGPSIVTQPTVQRMVWLLDKSFEAEEGVLNLIGV